jgi:hypothetical protein
MRYTVSRELSPGVGKIVIRKNVLGEAIHEAKRLAGEHRGIKYLVVDSPSGVVLKLFRFRAPVWQFWRHWAADETEEAEPFS